MLLRKCRYCGLEANSKEELEFFTIRDRKYGRDNLCKKCRNKYQRERTAKKVWNLDNIPIFKKCRVCGLEAHTKEELEPFVKHRSSPFGRASICRECFRKFQQKRSANIRLLVLKHYSENSPKCACCGESHIEFLTMDHINGGGRQHLKQIKGKYSSLTDWIYRNNFPNGFRVLCWNCNSSLGQFGYCPHKKKGKLD